MNKIRKSLMILGIIFLGVVLYANLRQVSPSERLRSISLVSFDLKAPANEQEKADLEKSVSGMAGVTACTVSQTGTLASVTFYPDLLSREELGQFISSHCNSGAALHPFATTGGCPVHAASASVSQFLALLDLRD